MLVEQTNSLPSSPADKVTLGVLDVQVRDEVMVPRVEITPRFTSEDPDRAAPSKREV